MPKYLTDLRCPRCKKSAMKVAANADVTKRLTCVHCGHANKIGELKTPSGKSLNDHLAKIAMDALARVKGVKPGR